MSSRKEQALDLFRRGYACSQALLAAFGPDLGLDRDSALRLGAGFVGGLGMTGGACGSVVGAVAVVGLKYADPSAKRPAETHARAAEIAGEFVRRFERLRGPADCRSLLRCDVSTKEGLKAALDGGFFQFLCPHFVGDAADILEQLFEEYDAADR